MERLSCAGPLLFLFFSCPSGWLRLRFCSKLQSTNVYSLLFCPSSLTEATHYTDTISTANQHCGARNLDFIKEDELYDWRTNDAACLYVRYTRKTIEPPQKFACRIIGHSGIVRPETQEVATRDMVFLGAGLFGPPREKTEISPGWTGDSYRFGVYAYQPNFGREHIIILRTDGGGFYAYIDVSLTAAEMWRHLCQACSPEMLWNVCSCVVHTYDLAVENGRQAVMQLFADGRLRKKKGRNGGFQIYVQPKVLIPQTSSPR